MESFIGTIMPWLLSWAPTGWMLCQGQIVPISSNEALFALIGNTYGGDGRTTFGIPDLRNTMFVGAGPTAPLGIPIQQVSIQFGGTGAVAQQPAASGSIVGPAAVGTISGLPSFLPLNWIICTEGLYPNKP